jgi:hypothetical protein
MIVIIYNLNIAIINNQIKIINGLRKKTKLITKL